MECKPLRSAGQVEVGTQPPVEAVDEVVAGIDTPGFESELGIGRKADADEGVVPGGVDPGPHAFAAVPIPLIEVCAGGILYDVAVYAGRRQLVEIPGAICHTEGVLHPRPVLKEGNAYGIEPDSARDQPFGTQPERQGQGIAVRTVKLQGPECGPFCPEEVVHDVVGPGREPQPEVGQYGLQRIHVETQVQHLPFQRFDAPGQERLQRIERFGREEVQMQISRLYPGACCGRIGPECETERTHPVDWCAVPEGDAVQGDAGVVTFRCGRGFGIEVEYPSDRLGDESQCRQIEPSDAPRCPELLPFAGHFSCNSEREPQGRIPVLDPSRQLLLRQFGLQPDPSEVVPAVRSPGNVQPDPASGLGGPWIETLALRRECQVEPSERIVRQKTPHRETVTTNRRVVSLPRSVEPSLQCDTTLLGIHFRSQRVVPAVRRCRPRPCDSFREVQTPAQCRVGQDLQQERRIAEFAPEACRCRQPLRFERITGLAVQRKGKPFGRGELQPDLSELLQGSRRGEMQAEQPVIQCRGDACGGCELQVAGCHLGLQIGGQRRAGILLQDACPRRQIGLQEGGPCGEFESRERNPLRAHFETALRPDDTDPAPLGKGQLPELQGDVSTSVVERIDGQCHPRKLDLLRIESLRRTVPLNSVGEPVVGHSQLPDPDAPGLCGRCGRALSGRVNGLGRLRRHRLFCSRCRGGGGCDEVGIIPPVDPYACDGNLLAVEPYPALFHPSFGQLYRQLRIRSGPSHPESGMADGERVEIDDPTQRGGCVGPLFGNRLPGVEEDGGTVESDASYGGLFVTQVGPYPFQGKPSCGDPHLESRGRIPIAGRHAFDCEVADDRFPADQRPGLDLQRNPSAIDERVGPVDQPDLLDGKPQWKAQPDISDGEFHAEGL